MKFKEEKESGQEEKTPIEGVVTAVERHPKKANRYHVYINEELAFTVHEDVLIKHRIMRGHHIDSGEAELIAAEEERHATWADALTYMGRKPRALREVKIYLKRKGHSETLAEEAVKRLEEQGYADDAQFAQQWAEHRMIEQRKGRRWVQQELQHKGVKRELIQEALAQVDPQEELAAARHLAQKRWSSMQGAPADKRRKLMAFLLRRGYSGSLVSGIIRDLLAAEDADGMEDNWEPELEMDSD